MEEKNNNNKDPVYQRLYKLRVSKEEKQIINPINYENNKIKPRNNSQEKSKKFKNKSTQHIKNISCNLPNEIENIENQEKEEVIYKTLNTEENVTRKSLNINNYRKFSKKKIEYMNNQEINNYNTEVKNNNRKREKTKDALVSNTSKNLNFKNPLDNSNKFLFNKYTSLFRNVFEELFNDFISKGIEMDYTKGVTIDFLLQFFFKLKFFYLINANNDANENDNSFSNEELKNIIKPQENNLFEEIYENIRDSDGHISIDHFFIFSLAILDLLDYYILKAFQDKEKEIEKNKNNMNLQNRAINSASSENNLDKNGNLIIDKNLMDKINSELKSKIILNNLGCVNKHPKIISFLKRNFS